MVLILRIPQGPNLSSPVQNASINNLTWGLVQVASQLRCTALEHEVGTLQASKAVFLVVAEQATTASEHSQWAAVQEPQSLCDVDDKATRTVDSTGAHHSNNVAGDATIESIFGTATKPFHRNHGDTTKEATAGTTTEKADIKTADPGLTTLWCCY